MTVLAEQLFTKICSNSKLERDEAERLLERAVSERDSGLLQAVADRAAAIEQEDSLSWEQKLGYLKTERCLVGWSHSTQSDSVVQLSLQWLGGEEEEVRVKDAAGQCLGSLCAHHGMPLYIKCLPPVLQLIRVNLERRIEPDKEDVADGKLMDRKEWKNLAAWKDLDLSLCCLQRMWEGLCSHAKSHSETTTDTDTDTDILKLILRCLSHQNRFVRDSGYRTCTTLLRSGLGWPGLTQLTDSLCGGLSDGWSQVRLSATATTGALLVSLPPPARAQLYPALLPRLCLNRYFPGEAVRRQAQLSWQEVCGDQGRALLGQSIAQTVQYYLASGASHSPGAREAACHCITELVTKLPPLTVAPHVSPLLDCLSLCLEDTAWQVREAASVAASSVIRQQPELASSRVASLLAVFTRHLQDQASTVRQAAALALANSVRGCGLQVLSQVTQVIRRGLQGVREQKVIGRGLQGVREQEAAEGGAEPWEVGEGCVHTVAELSKMREHQEVVSSLLADIFQSCEYRHYPSHLQYCATVCRTLAQVATNLDKRHFKRHLQLDVIFLCLEGDSPAVRAAATDCLSTLSRVLGPNILRGRVENLNPNLLALHDSLMAGPACISSQARLSSEPRPIPRANSSNFPSLGGTPPT